MPTYRSLFAVAEFRVLFLNRCTVMISVAASGLALGTVVFETTRSPLLSALSMFGGPLVSLVTSQLLLASSDSVRPKTALLWQMAGALASDAPQLIGGLPWQARLALMAIPYVVNSMFSGTQWVIVRDVVPSGSFILARSTMNLASGGTQVVGYALGGLALIWLSPRGLFLAAAVADVACLVNVGRGIASRPARRADGGRGQNVVRRTAAVNLRLLASPVIRPLYLAQWIPNGLVVGCESLFVSYARTRPGGGGGLAGYLFAVTAAGMMAGDLVIGRLARPELRDRLIGPLRLLLAAPYLVLLLGPPPAAVIVAGFAASAGYAASLPLTDRLIRHTGEEIRGQVMGLQGQGMMAGQSAGALAAGAAARWLGPSAAMGVMAAASLAVTLALIPALRRSAGPRAEPAAAAPVPS